jgi:hypothetical protein
VFLLKFPQRKCHFDKAWSLAWPSKPKSLQLMQKMQNGKWVMNDKLGEQNTFSEVFFCEFFSGAS